MGKVIEFTHPEGRHLTEYLARRRALEAATLQAVENIEAAMRCARLEGPISDPEEQPQ